MKPLKPSEYRSSQGRLNVLEPLVESIQRDLVRCAHNGDALYKGLMDLSARTPVLPTTFLGRLKWVLRG